MSKLRSRSIRLLFALIAIVGLGVVGTASCTLDSAERGCGSDSDCRGARICVQGACRSVTAEDAAAADGSSPSRDGGRPSDTHRNVDTRTSHELAPRPDIAPRDTGSDEDVPIVRDTWTPSDVPPETDAGRRALSCHEFATCQFIVCDRYDYSCKQRYSARTSEEQLSQLDDRQRCVRQNCSGLQGQERLECTVTHCETEWNRCARKPQGGSTLECSEFHSCIHLCNGKEERNSCVSDCASRSTPTARQQFGAYAQCVEENCAGTEGEDQLECARNNCRSELAACWGC